MDRKTKAEELAATLRWLADRRVVEGLHPKNVRDAADLLEAQEKELATVKAALAANEHMVKLEAKKLPGYSALIEGTYAITSPRLYWCEYRFPFYEAEAMRSDWCTAISRALVHQCTAGWMRELEEATFKQVAAIDFPKLSEAESA